MTIWKDDDELDKYCFEHLERIQMLPLCTHEKALQNLVVFTNLNSIWIQDDTRIWPMNLPMGWFASEIFTLKSSLGGIFDLAEVLPSGLNSSDKHHVAKFAPVLATASAKYVHHMILFECSDEARTCWVHLQMYRVVNVDQCGKSCESMKGRCTSSS